MDNKNLACLALGAGVAYAFMQYRRQSMYRRHHDQHGHEGRGYGHHGHGGRPQLPGPQAQVAAGVGMQSRRPAPLPPPRMPIPQSVMAPASHAPSQVVHQQVIPSAVSMPQSPYVPQPMQGLPEAPDAQATFEVAPGMGECELQGF